MPLHTMGQKKFFLIPGMGVVGINSAKKYCLGSEVALQKPMPLHTMGQKRYVGWLCLKWTVPEKLSWFLGGAPNSHASAHHGPEKVFLDTWDGGV